MEEAPPCDPGWIGSCEVPAAIVNNFNVYGLFMQAGDFGGSDHPQSFLFSVNKKYATMLLHEKGCRGTEPYSL
jgi:hypothetical protein